MPDWDLGPGCFWSLFTPNTSTSTSQIPEVTVEFRSATAKSATWPFTSQFALIFGNPKTGLKTLYAKTICVTPNPSRERTSDYVPRSNFNDLALRRCNGSVEVQGVPALGQSQHLHGEPALAGRASTSSAAPSVPFQLSLWYCTGGAWRLLWNCKSIVATSQWDG